MAERGVCRIEFGPSGVTEGQARALVGSMGPDARRGLDWLLGQRMRLALLKATDLALPQAERDAAAGALEELSQVQAEVEGMQGS